MIPVTGSPAKCRRLSPRFFWVMAQTTCLPRLTEVLAWAGADKTPPLVAAIFLGDGTDDLAPASTRAGFTLSWNIVRGNGDINFSIPGAMVLEFPADGRAVRKLFLTHGHSYRLEEGFTSLAATARTNGAEAALFGHTHVPHCEMLNGIFLLNPGSVGRPRSKVGPTFAVLECPPSGPLGVRFFGLVEWGRKIVVRELQL